MENLNSQLFRLTSSDLVRSAATAVFAAVFVALAGMASAPGFDIFQTNWAEVVRLIINVSVSTFLGDVTRRFTSDQNGALFGRIGGNKN